MAPFGGNIEGVGAASRIFFGKSPDRLTLGESLTLAVIPQRPAGRAGRSAGAGDVLAAREQLGRAWLQRTGARRSCGRRPPAGRAAHRRSSGLHDALEGAALRGRAARRRQPGRPRRHHARQRVAARARNAGRQFIAERGENGLRNAAAVLVDTRDMGVKAWVGAADYWNARDGQVNGVLAKRSPGSALKPFIYALALDQGVLHPRTMLRDAPSAFGPFTPENFDGRFVGPITAQDALIRSRNIPAVWAASQLTQPTLYQFLESAGVRDLKPEAFYGLALALGGGEITMEELAGLYAMLANGGVLKPIRMTARTDRLSAPESAGVRLLSPEASFITLDMLRHNARPGRHGTGAGAHALARRVEDRYVLGFPRCVDRGRCRAVRAGGVDRQLQRRRESGIRRRGRGGAAVFQDRRRSESGAPVRRRVAAGAAARCQQRGGLRGQRRSAERGLSAHREHLVHPRQVADPRESAASRRRDRCGDRRARVRAVSAGHALRSVRVLVRPTC